MTSDNIAEYVGENNQFTEKPVTEYPPVIQNNTVTTKDYLNRPGFPGECFICELRLPDHRFRWK
ncbi:hypothetical protein ACP0GM_25005, partial [Escherichia coli]